MVAWIERSFFDAQSTVHILTVPTAIPLALGDYRKNIEKNDMALAEEVTVVGSHTKRPDIVLYVNGIAIGVLELKRSTVAVCEGIRQNLDNQT